MLDYLPVILTVLVATLVSLLAIRTSISEPEMLQWILVVLALLATTQLVDRFRTIRSIDANIERLVESNHGLQGANAFFVKRLPNMEERLLSAATIAINGMTLSRTSDTFFGTFLQRLREESKIRILIIDPNHEAMKIAAKRFHKHQDAEQLRREAEHSIDNFKSLMKQMSRDDLFEVRFLPFVPAYGIWLIDKGNPRAEIWVELYSFQDEPEPTFQLLPHQDGEWFTFFERQFELMWSAGTEWKLVMH
jgi:hypothetical protein